MRLRHALYLISCLGLLYVIFHSSTSASGASRNRPAFRDQCQKDDGHVIDLLIYDANRTFTAVQNGRTNDVKDGAAAYRERRGRHPPPWFDRWYTKAQSLDAVIVEDFFDQIYHDLEPFWAISPQHIRASINDWKLTAKVRNGRAVEIPQERFRTRVWGDMLKEIASELPDLDLALNGLDEPRVVAAWETINENIATAKKQKEQMMSLPRSSLVQGFPNPKQPDSTNTQTRQWFKQKDQFYKALQNSCPLDSTFRNLGDQQPIIWKSVPVPNVTYCNDICEHPGLTKRHGFLIEPASIDTTTSLMPIFSSAKPRTHNDILLPEPAYYSENKLFNGKDWLGDWSSTFSWNEKFHGLVWRGATTGGHARTDTWENFHRHRFVSRLNASNGVSIDEFTTKPRLQTGYSVPGWLSGLANVGFSKILCSRPQAEQICPVINEKYEALPFIKMNQQFKYKYLPDIDGNTLSGRFRTFMASNSAVMKGTLFKEWHDSRLVAWKHYIPLDVYFDSVYDILAYFLGIGSVCSHDAAGERIANDGQAWANTVLRKEDMLVYMHRLLLEYARIVNDERDHLGYVEDLVD